MRRIIHNTTAIAACLSLMAPHLAMAQTALPGPDQAVAPQNLILAQAEPAPDGQVPPPADAAPAPADAEPQSGADMGQPEPAPMEEPAPAEQPAQEAPAEAPPAPADAPAEQPEPAPMDAPEQQPVETPAPQAAPEAAPNEPAAQPAPAPEAAAPAAEADPQPAPDSTPPPPEPEAMQTQAPEPRPAAEPEAAPAPNPGRTAEPAPAAGEAAPRANPQRETQPAEDAPVEPRPNARPAAQNDQQPTDVPTDADALAEALRAQDPAGQPDADPAPAVDAPAARNGLSLATGGVQTERATALPGLAGVLRQEVDGGLDTASLTCLNGGSFPCADGGRAMTPNGVVVETNEAGELRLAPTEAQMYRVGQNGEMVRRAAEEDTVETEASREAAQAAQPSTAAALDAADGSGEITEQQVTEDSTRSSSEDFTTSLRDALAGATGETAPQAEEEDDDNRLRNALLLGLGAVAVGSYLNNNRQVALSAPDRVVVTRADGSQEVIKDEVALLRQPGSTVQTENFDDGSSRTIVTRQDGSRVVTIRDANLQVLRRTLVSADGTTTQLIDDTMDVQPVDISALPAPATVQTGNTPLNEDQLREALQREANVDRRFTLSQIRNIPEVRALVAPVNIDAITFDTGSAAIRSDQAQQLQGLGRAIQDQITQNPREIFMIEGHTDTVGSDPANLALSDRRAESVALALTEYFDVPPENLVTQGYGEQFLRIRSEGDIRDNRRASVRRITDLLAQ
ncbi:OmpA family protein [Paracoccus sp. Ld10]|uniref:OmpA family protein n=1 Tax=Paracoccus sp. Ld10 TaxID=649158 RepID=UPI00386A8CEB